MREENPRCPRCDRQLLSVEERRENLCDICWYKERHPECDDDEIILLEGRYE